MSGFTITALVLIVIWLIITPRTIRRMQHGDSEWRDAWRALDSGRRKTIQRKLRHGQAVEDPGDAELALRAVAQVHHVKEAMHPTSVLGTMVLVVLLVGGIVDDEPVMVIIAGAGLGLSALMGVLSAVQDRRRQLSAQRTRALHPELGLSD